MIQFLLIPCIVSAVEPFGQQDPQQNGNPHDGNNCCICVESMDNNTPHELSISAAHNHRHLMHNECLLAWLRQEELAHQAANSGRDQPEKFIAKCPLCRQVITDEEFREIQRIHEHEPIALAVHNHNGIRMGQQARQPDFLNATEAIESLEQQLEGDLESRDDDDHINQLLASFDKAESLLNKSENFSPNVQTQVWELQQRQAQAALQPQPMQAAAQSQDSQPRLRGAKDSKKKGSNKPKPAQSASSNLMKV